MWRKPASHPLIPALFCGLEAAQDTAADLALTAYARASSKPDDPNQRVLLQSGGRKHETSAAGLVRKKAREACCTTLKLHI